LTRERGRKGGGPRAAKRSKGKETAKWLKMWEIFSGAGPLDSE